MNIIKAVRNIRNEMKVDPGRRIEAFFLADGQQQKILEEGKRYIKNLARIEDINIKAELKKRPQPASTAIVDGIEIILPLTGMLDLQKELVRLKKEIENVNYEIERARGKLANKGFVNNAPQNLVEGEKEKLEDYQDKKEKLLDRIEQLELN